MNSRAKGPNILILIPHDLGTFLGCYGQAGIPSPRLDQLAAQGVSFHNCFTTSPECTPSRGSLMTGLYPHQNGLMGLSNFGWSLRVPHLATRLRDAGYRALHFGFQHETHESVETLGYDRSVQGASHAADVVCDDVSTFLRSPEARGATPWFIYAGFSHVHRAWKKATHTKPQDVQVPAWLPDHPEVRMDLARFYEAIEELDQAVGTVFSTVQETGLDTETLVVFTTDHGAAFPGAKATLYDPGIHVPLILHWPSEIEGGGSHNELVSNMDLMPTLLEFAGIEVPPSLAGRTLLPLLRGQPHTPRDQVCGALFYDVAYDPMHYVRTHTHKYIRSFATTEGDAAGADPETLTTFAAGRWIRVDDFDVLTSPTWQALAPAAGAPRPPVEELYDLTQDPCERTNLADRADAAPILQDMRARLRLMMESTNSPLLHGHVQPPPEQCKAVRTHAPNSERSRETIAKRKALQCPC